MPHSRLPVILNSLLPGFLIATFLIFSGCSFFDSAPVTPTGYSQDQNNRTCATYETKSSAVYRTECDYGGQYPVSVTNPLLKHE